MKDETLFSVVVLVYRHYEYLYSAVRSILSQDYHNIELIISDDGSTNFPKEEISKFIENNKTENIRSVLVRQEPKNIGTVKHLNSVRKLCNGKYIVFLAGDDELNGSNTLSSYVRHFTDAPSGCLIQMAQTAMYDEKMESIMEYYLTKPVQDAIVNTKNSTEDLLQMLVRFGPCLPSTSTCFTKEFFERFGDFDESYKLVEDFPMHFRLAKEGWIIHYANFVAIKHRHGGISHGQTNALSASTVRYYSDLLNMNTKLILPSISTLPKEERKYVRRYWNKSNLYLEYTVKRNSDNPGLRYIILSGIRTLKHSISRFSGLTSSFFILFIVLSVLGNPISQMIYLEFAINISGALQFLTWGLFVCYLGLSVMRFIRKLFIWAKEFPRSVISLG